tara:strand:+ start:346 stop:942 length:597 start_codon:yes stop_codon:yes gene_type:complete
MPKNSDLSAPINLTENFSVPVCPECGSTNVREWKPFGGGPRGNCSNCHYCGPFETVQFVRLDAVKALVDDCTRMPWKVYTLGKVFLAHAQRKAHDHACDICDEETMCGGGACIPDDRSLFLCPDCFNNDLPEVTAGSELSGREVILAAKASGLPANSTRSELVTWLCENDRNGDFAQDEFTIREAWHAVGCVSGVLDE